MKRSRLKQVGKIGKRNKQANVEIKEMFVELGTRCCEICPILIELGELKNPCFHDNFLSFAHRHKRLDYRSRPEMLSSFNQVALACQNGHDTIEYNKELTQKVFNILRGKDELNVQENN